MIKMKPSPKRYIKIYIALSIIFKYKINNFKRRYCFPNGLFLGTFT